MSRVILRLTWGCFVIRSGIMKIIYLGSGEFGIECLNALHQPSNHIELVITQPAQPAGRGQKIRETPVCTWAKEKHLPIIEPDDVNSPQVVEKVKQAGADIAVVIAFGQKIGGELISQAPKGAINVHASLLPKYRGAAPINWAIINGEKQTGVSIITVAEKMDAGDVIAQCVTDIGPDETTEQLGKRLSRLAAPLLVKTLALIEQGKAVYQPQDESKVTRAPKLKKSDGFIDFNESAETIRRKILGLSPWPGAAVSYISKKTGKSCRVIIGWAQVIGTGNPDKLSAGTVDKDLNIICGRDALKITRIKPAGGSVMNFNDFVNGRGVSSGDFFARVED